MNYMEIVLLIVIPYVIYKIIIWWMKTRWGLDISKMIGNMIFATVDIIIFIIYHYLK